MTEIRLQILMKFSGFVLRGVVAPIYLIVAVAILSPLSVMAQQTDEVGVGHTAMPAMDADADNNVKVRFCARGALDLNIDSYMWAKMSEDEELRPGGRLSFSTIFTWPSRWFVDASLFFGYDTAYILTPYHHYHTNSRLDKGLAGISVTPGYTLEFTPDVGMSIFVGAEFTCGLFGNLRYPGVDRKLSLYGDGLWRRCNVAPKLGLEVGLKDFAVGYSVSVGLIRMNRQDIFCHKTINELSMAITLSYYFAERILSKAK